MQLKRSRFRVRAAIRGGVVLLTISLGACEPAHPPETAPQAQATTPQTEVPADPILAYVSMGPVGKTAVVNDPQQGGNVIVVINRQYNAASGDVCRTYAVTSSSLQSQHLACGNGASWQEVPPLVTSSN